MKQEIATRINSYFKKIIITVLVTLMAFTVITVLSGTDKALADAPEEFGIWVGGVSITTDNYSNVTGVNIQGNVSFDPSKRVLTLESVRINRGLVLFSDDVKNVYGIYLNTSKPITIRLIGSNDCELSTQYTPGLSEIYGLYSGSTDCDITIEGSGTLNTKVDNLAKAHATGMFVNGNLTIKDGTTVISRCKDRGKMGAIAFWANDLVVKGTAEAYVETNGLSGTGARVTNLSVGSNAFLYSTVNASDSDPQNSYGLVLIGATERVEISGDVSVMLQNTPNSIGVFADFPKKMSIKNGARIAVMGTKEAMTNINVSLGDKMDLVTEGKGTLYMGGYFSTRNDVNIPLKPSEIAGKKYIGAYPQNIVTVKAMEASCTWSGNKACYYCSTCTSFYKDKTHKNRLKYEDIRIPKNNNHIWDKGKVTTAPTQKKEGVKTFTCLNDSKHKKTEIIPKLGGILERIYENNRYGTAFDIGTVLKKEKGSKKFNSVVVASGTNFPDALSGAYLAKVKGAPIILVNKSSEAIVVSYIKTHVAKGGTIYILGGKGAVPTSIDGKFSGYSVKRLSGTTRYDTNIAILEEAGVKTEEIIVCSGTNYADALSASGTGKPVLLVGASLTNNQKTYLKNLKTKKYYIAGGTGAVATSTEKEIASFGDKKPERLSGSNRYETSVKIATKFFKNPKSIVLAYALNFPDGLSGGPLALQVGGPVILANSNTTNNGFAKTYVDSKGVDRCIILGGNSLISDTAAKDIMSTHASIKRIK